MKVGLIINVYSHPHYRQCAESSSGPHTGPAGLSARFDTLTLVNAEGPSEPTTERPAVALVAGNTAGTLKIVPVLNCGSDDDPEWQEFKPDHLVGPMAGGNYGATSDSRFGQLAESILGRPFYGAVAIHDRFETAEQYEALSR